MFRNKFRIFLYRVRTIPFLSCRLKFYPEHRSYKPRQRMQTFRTKFYLRLWSILTRRQGSSAPVHHSDITFEILKGTLRACLYADFWFLRHSDITFHLTCPYVPYQCGSLEDFDARKTFPWLSEVLCRIEIRLHADKSYQLAPWKTSSNKFHLIIIVELGIIIL